MTIDYKDMADRLLRNERQPAERIADALEFLCGTQATQGRIERLVDMLAELVKVGEALGQIAEEALGRYRSPGGFRATSAEGDAELVDQDDADLARMEAEDARKELTPREIEQADGYEEVTFETLTKHFNRVKADLAAKTGGTE